MSTFASKPPDSGANRPRQANFRTACCSHPGLQRERNEDACALPPPGVEESRYGTLLVLADGVGGMPGGEIASREAVHYLQAIYYAASGSQDLAERLRQSVVAVNALNRQTQRNLGVEQAHLTTLVATVLFEDQIWVANVGDSRAYLVGEDDRARHQLTEDHSGHLQMVKAGLIDEASNDVQKDGRITRAIGLQDDCQVDTYRYHWAPGDRLVLCSDGLAFLAEEEMVSVALDKAVDLAAQELVERAVQADGSDNCTAVVAAWLPAVETGLEPVLKSRPTLAPAPGQATHLSKPKPSPGTARPESDPPPAPNETPGPGRSGFSIKVLLLGMLIGWLVAALLFFYLLHSPGALNLF